MAGTVDFDQRGVISMSTKFGGGIKDAYSPGIPPARTGLTAGGSPATGGQSGVLENTHSGLPSPVNFLIALLIVIVAMRLIGDSPKTSIEGAHIHIGGYNVLTILAITWFGTVLAKMILNRWQVRGLTDLVNAV